MSVNQFTSSNIYKPEAAFNVLGSQQLKCDNISSSTGNQRFALSNSLTECKLPLNLTDAFGASFNNRFSFAVDGTNTALKLQAQGTGGGSYLEFNQPAGDNDFRIAVDPSSNILFSCKSPIIITDEAFAQSVQINKVAGTGLKLLNFAAAGYSASDLNCYTTASLTSALTGFSAPINLTATLSRVGNIVTIKINSISATALGGVISIPVGDIPVVFRPSSNTECVVPTTSSNSVLRSGVVTISSSGSFSFQYGPGIAYSAAAASGWNTFGCSYVV